MLPSRKSPRLKGYDYKTPNYYFITVCAHNKVCYFGQPGDLNHLGEIAKQGLEQIPQHFPGVSLDKYIVMPNHIHAIIILNGREISLPTIIGQFKAFVSRKIHLHDPDIKVWQSSFHDHVIRSEADYLRIWNYIDGNPFKWSEDCYYIQQCMEAAES
ncbi:MAG: hypothetical protein E7437_07635 [Ruminococcaceae bacterium]|nr:hypothetical protein [Oscillospiraceae bacterium]